MSYDGLYTYHDRLVIPRPAQALRILLLTKYHDYASHPTWRRLFIGYIAETIWMGTNVF
jgi:hypothetical protein